MSKEQRQFAHLRWCLLVKVCLCIAHHEQWELELIIGKRPTSFSN